MIGWLLVGAMIRYSRRFRAPREHDDAWLASRIEVSRLIADADYDIEAHFR